MSLTLLEEIDINSYEISAFNGVFGQWILREVGTVALPNFTYLY